MKDLPKLIEQKAPKRQPRRPAEKRKKSFAEKIAEGVRRDLEKLDEARRPRRRRQTAETPEADILTY